MMDAQAQEARREAFYSKVRENIHMYTFGKGMRFASVENLLMCNDYPAFNQKSLPNREASSSTAAMTAALDDFRELGAAYLKHYFPWSK